MNKISSDYKTTLDGSSSAGKCSYMLLNKTMYKNIHVPSNNTRESYRKTSNFNITQSHISLTLIKAAEKTSVILH